MHIGGVVAGEPYVFYLVLARESREMKRNTEEKALRYMLHWICADRAFVQQVSLLYDVNDVLSTWTWPKGRFKANC